MIKKINLITSLLVISLLVTSCGKQKYSDVTLVEPTVMNETYMPVVKNQFGDPVISYARVEAKTYCVYWNTSTTIEEVFVKPGQMVKKGDPIAAADVSGIDSRIESLQSDIARKNSVNAQEDAIYEYQLQELNYKKQWAEESGDSDAYKQIENEIAILDENKHFNDLMHSHRVSEISKEIDELLAIKENNVLEANHDGMVTYIVDIADNNVCGKSINVAIISDYNDTYLSFDDETSVKYEIAYGLYMNEKHPIEEIEYSEYEKTVAKRAGIELPKRLKFSDGTPLPEVGIDIPIIRYERGQSDVLTVDLRAVYEDEKGNFVYVKSDNGETEKRYVEIGRKSKIECEILSGLEEGELIYQKYVTAIPEEYELESVVAVDDFRITKSYKNSLAVIDTKNFIEHFNGAGIVQNILPSGYNVKAGELVCQISTSDGAAILFDAETKIDNSNIQYNKDVEQINEGIEMIREQIEQAKTDRDAPTILTNDEETTIVGISTKTDAEEGNGRRERVGDEEEKAIREQNEQPVELDPYIVEELECQLEVMKCNLEIININHNYEIAEYRKAYDEVSKNNDGSGVFSIYAPEDGVINRQYVHEGQEIINGQSVYALGTKTKPYLAFKLSGDDIGLNGVIDVEIDGNKVGSGIVNGCNISRGYLNDIDGKIEISETKVNGNPTYYLDSDDEEVYSDNKDKTIKYSLFHFKKALIIPIGCVESEEYRKGEVLNYVWKQLEDGSIVKQYIYGVFKVGDVDYCVLTGLNEGDVILRPKRGDSISGKQSTDGGIIIE